MERSYMERKWMTLEDNTKIKPKQRARRKIHLREEGHAD